MDDAPRYHSAKTIGQGAIGVVQRVFDERLGRVVAYKSLLPAASSPAGVERFLREARITAQIEHPGVVPVHDIGVAEDGSPYYTMRYVRGTTLAARLKGCRDLDERLALLAHFVDVCQAIGFAHARGVVHRDLKPANVMVGEHGETQILDWGLAKTLGESHERDEEISRIGLSAPPTDSGSTVMGTVLGTPAYMSPEQASGRVDRIDRRSDVWSLGVVLYEILAGRRPFLGADALAVVAAVRLGGAPRLAEVAPAAPAELRAIAEKAMSVDPGARYPDAAALAADVDAWMTGRPVSAYPYSGWDRLVRWVAVHRASVAIAAASAVVLAVGGVVALRQVVQERDRAVDAEQVAHLRLRDLYAERALERLTDGRFPEAALLAATSLALGENADARGVIVAAESNWPARTGAWRRACLDVALEPDGAMLCASGDGLFRREPDGVERALHEHPSFRVERLPDGTLVSFEPVDRAWVLRPDGALSPWPTSGWGNLSSAAVLDDRRFAYGTGPTVGLVEPSGARGITSAPGAVISLALHPDRDRWVFGSLVEGLWWLWPDGRFAPLPGGDGTAGRSIAWSSDGRLLLVGTTDGELHVLDAITGQQVARPFQAHLGAVNAVGWVDAETVVSVGEDGLFSWHDVSGRLLCAIGANSTTSLRTSGDGQVVTWDASTGLVQRWGVGALADRSGRLGDGQEGLSTAAFLGQDILTFHGTGWVRRWREGRLLVGRQVSDTVLKHGSVSPDGRYVVAASSNGPLYRLDADSLEEIARVDGGGFVGTGITADGQSVVSTERSAAEGHGVSVIDVTTGDRRTLARLGGRDLSVFGDDRVAFVDGHGGAHVVDLRNGAELAARADVDAREIAWLDADTVLLSEESGTLARWSWRTDQWGGRAFGDLTPHEAPIDGLTVSPDGRFVVTASWDRTIQVWTAEGLLLARLRGHRHRVGDVSFAADGRSLVSAGWDGEARVWSLERLSRNPSDVIAKIRGEVGLELIDGRVATIP